MAHKYEVEFEATISGTYIYESDNKKSLEEVEELAGDEIESELEPNSGEFSDTRVDVTISECKKLSCDRCHDLGFTLSVVGENDGLLKATPCTYCLRVPTPKHAVDRMLEIIEQEHERIAEGEDE